MTSPVSGTVFQVTSGTRTGGQLSVTGTVDLKGKKQEPLAGRIWMLCSPRAWVTVSSSVVSSGPGPPGLPRGQEQCGFSANRKIGATGDVYLGTAAFNDSLNEAPKITEMDKSLQCVPHWHLQRTAGLPRRSVPTALPCLQPLWRPRDLTCSDGKEMHSDQESWSVTEMVLGWVFNLMLS